MFWLNVFGETVLVCLIWQITEFGLAKMRDISMRSAPSHSHSRRSDEGTVAFTAPAVFSGEQVDEKEMKSDVYS